MVAEKKNSTTRKICSAMRFAPLFALPLAYITEIAEYAVKNGSVVKGMERMLYDAALNSSGSTAAGIVRAVCFIVGALGCVIYGLIYCTDNRRARKENIILGIAIVVLAMMFRERHIIYPLH